MAQTRLDEISHIVALCTELVGDEGSAINWFRHQPIPGFGMTAEELVEAGRVDLVIEDLDRMADGVYS